MDERPDESQSQEFYVTSPTEAPRQRQRSPDESKDRPDEARDVTEDQGYRPDVDASSKRPRHEREYSPIAQRYEYRDGSPIPTAVCTDIVEGERDAAEDGGEETRATRASKTRQEADENPAATYATRDVPRSREPRKTASRKDILVRAPAPVAQMHELSTTSSSSELRPTGLPPKEKRQSAARSDTPVERRKSSKASVGGTSTTSGRLQTSSVSVSRSRSRVSRASSKTTRSDRTAPPHGARPSDTAPWTAGPLTGRPGPSKATRSENEPSRADSAVRIPRQPREPNRSNISRKSTTKQATRRSASKADVGGRKPQPSADPNIAEASRVSNASGKPLTSGKAPAPTNRGKRGSAISADRRSLASKASAGSRRSRASAGRTGDQSGSSKKTSDGRPGPRYERHQHPDWQGDLNAERDTSSASMVPLAGDSRLSAKSSGRSLRPIGPEEVPLDKVLEGKPKGKLLLMPDGTYVPLQEKNIWIRAMQEKYLAIDYKTCSLKVGFGLMLLGFIYIIMFRQDILLNMAIFVRDYVYDPDADTQSKQKYKQDNKTSPGERSSTPKSLVTVPPRQVTSHLVRRNRMRA